MFLILKMAWRNIFRHRRRSMFTFFMMMGGFVLTSVAIGWSDGVYDGVIEKFTSSLTGQIQIHAEGYLEKPTLYKTMANYENILKEVEFVKGVKAASPRIYGAALASHGEKSGVARIVGIDEDREEKTTNIFNKIIKGQKELKNKQIMIGKSLAKILGVKTGDSIVLLSQGADGSIANDIYVISAILDMGNDMDNKTALYMNIQDAQDFFYLYNQTHEIVIRTKSIKKIEKVQRRIEEKIKDPSLSIKRWQEFMPAFYRAMKADKQGGYISVIIVVIMLGIGVLNTVLMAVLERTREYGLLKALGTSPKRVFFLVITEMIFIALISSFVGMILGIGVNYYFSKYPIVLSQTFSYGGMDFNKMAAEINLNSILIPFITIFVVTFFISLFPALKAAKTDPAKTMRFI